MARKSPKNLVVVLDLVRQTLIYSLWVMHGIIGVLAVAIVFGHYDNQTLDVIQSMFSSTLTAIAGTAFILAGDRVGKNLTGPAQIEKKEKIDESTVAVTQ